MNKISFEGTLKKTLDDLKQTREDLMAQIHALRSTSNDERISAEAKLAIRMMNKIEENKDNIDKKTSDNLTYLEARIDKLDVLAFEHAEMLKIEKDVGAETEHTSIATDEVESEAEEEEEETDGTDENKPKKEKK